uniref:Uncharacterized protein n=1 Tax=Caenorhabditis japonica TaxID=281687 RepID=A0A8R1EHF9_CAEJA
MLPSFVFKAKKKQIFPQKLDTPIQYRPVLFRRKTREKCHLDPSGSVYLAEKSVNCGFLMVNETNPDECDRIGDNPMVNEETEGFWEEHVENTERHTRMGWRKNFKKFLVCQNLINKLQNLVTERNYGRLRLCVWILKTSNAQNRRPICCLAFLEAKRSPHTKFLIAVMTSKNASSAAKKGTNSKEALQGGGDGANPAFN